MKNVQLEPFKNFIQNKDPNVTQVRRNDAPVSTSHVFIVQTVCVCACVCSWDPVIIIRAENRGLVT